MAPSCCKSGFPTIRANATGRLSCDPCLNIFRPIPDQHTDLVELRPPVKQAPSPQRGNADVELLGYIVFGEKIKHIPLSELFDPVYQFGQGSPRVAVGQNGRKWPGAESFSRGNSMTREEHLTQREHARFSRKMIVTRILPRRCFWV
jgi:hypothetical protein